MDRTSLAIFANFFIDNEERLQRMKDSFHSFKGSNPNQWVINIRGQLKHQAGDFLKNEIGNKLQLFYLESRRSWFCDSRIIVKNIISNYVLFWIEDHILVAKTNFFNNCIAEMNKFKADQLWYSWFTSDKKVFSTIKPYKVGNYIKLYKLNLKASLKIQRNYFNNFYNVTCVSIMKKKFFMKIIFSNKPYFKRWARNLPFDFEKQAKDKVATVIWHAMPKKELFASIDDDHFTPEDSLISRGLYPNRASREFMKKIEHGHSTLARVKLRKLTPAIIRPFILELFRFGKRIVYTINFFWNK